MRETTAGEGSRVVGGGAGRRRVLVAALGSALAMVLASTSGVGPPSARADGHGQQAGPARVGVERDHPGHVRVTVEADPDGGSGGGEDGEGGENGEDGQDDPGHDPGGHDEGAGEEPDTEGLHLPDLVPWHPFHVVIAGLDGPVTAVDGALASARGHERPQGRALRFTTTIENVGDHSFEIFGVPRSADPGQGDPEDAGQVTAFQCVRFSGPEVEGAQRACAEHHEVGTLTYHAHHGHFHIDGFARYELRRDADGHPAYGSPDVIVARAEKVGFCVQDMWYARGEPSPQPWYQWCRGTPTVPYAFTQGISPGWTDTYFAGFSGQQIPLEGVPDGVYWITITVNPPDNPTVSLLEADRANNTSWTQVRISGEGTEVEVLEERGRGSPSSD